MPILSKLKPFDKVSIARKCPGLSIPQKLTLLVIASRLGKNEFCYLSLDTLQIECSIGGRRHLVKYLKQLSDIGLLLIIPPGDGFSCNRYGINFELIINKTDEMIINKAVPTGELRQFPLSKKQFPFGGRQFPRGNSNRTHKDLKEIKRESLVDNFEKAKQARSEYRQKLGLKKRDE